MDRRICFAELDVSVARFDGLKLGISRRDSDERQDAAEILIGDDTFRMARQLTRAYCLSRSSWRVQNERSHSVGRNASPPGTVIGRRGGSGGWQILVAVELTTISEHSIVTGCEHFAILVRIGDVIKAAKYCLLSASSLAIHPALVAFPPTPAATFWESKLRMCFHVAVPTNHPFDQFFEHPFSFDMFASILKNRRPHNR
jgi:hypothetical protein